MEIIFYVVSFCIGVFISVFFYKYTVEKQGVKFFIVLLPYAIFGILSTFPFFTEWNTFRLIYFFFMMGIFLTWAIQESYLKKIRM